MDRYGRQNPMGGYGKQNDNNISGIEGVTRDGGPCDQVNFQDEDGHIESGWWAPYCMCLRERWIADNSWPPSQHYCGLGGGGDWTAPCLSNGACYNRSGFHNNTHCFQPVFWGPGTQYDCGYWEQHCPIQDDPTCDTYCPFPEELVEWCNFDHSAIRDSADVPPKDWEQGGPIRRNDNTNPIEGMPNFCGGICGAGLGGCDPGCHCIAGVCSSGGGGRYRRGPRRGYRTPPKQWRHGGRVKRRRR